MQYNHLEIAQLVERRTVNPQVEGSTPSLVKDKKFKLKPEDITIHYFKREPTKFEVSEHKILENGKLSPSFPQGFFDASYSLVKQLL